MNKMSPLLAGVIGAVILTLQQFISQPSVDWRVIVFAVVMAILGVVGTQLKGKGASFWGIVGTVIYTFWTLQTNNQFTVKEFVITGLIAVLSVFTPTFIPQADEPVSDSE